MYFKVTLACYTVSNPLHTIIMSYRSCQVFTLKMEFISASKILKRTILNSVSRVDFGDLSFR